MYVILSNITLVNMFILNCRICSLTYILTTILVMTCGDNDLPCIHGGDPIAISEVPFIAMYRPSTRKHWCGATIVHERFLVSAAHCYKGLLRLGLTGYITVGSDKANEGGETYDIKKTHPHPNHDNVTKDNDIVILELEKPLNFSKTVQPLQLAPKDVKVEDGTELDTMGFGVTEHGTYSNELLKVTIPLINREKCKEVYQNLTERMICAGYEGKDSCQGDSGGPLRFKDMLLGVVSYGIKCGQKGYPGVYASVPALRDFIDEIISANS